MYTDRMDRQSLPCQAGRSADGPRTYATISYFPRLPETDAFCRRWRDGFPGKTSVFYLQSYRANAAWDVRYSHESDPRSIDPRSLQGQKDHRTMLQSPGGMQSQWFSGAGYGPHISGGNRPGFHPERNLSPRGTKC